MRLDAECLTLVESVELVVVAKATTVNKLLTLLSLIVVEVAVRSAVASAHRAGQITAICKQKQLKPLNRISLEVLLRNVCGCLKIEF